MHEKADYKVFNNNLVFNIQRYSIHDGPGIRTIIFLKWCLLNCLWCSNPEGIGFKKELGFNKNLCKKCYHCVEVCPTGAIKKTLMV